MNPAKKFYYILLGTLGLLLVLLIGGTYGTSKLLTAEASKLATLKAKNLALSKEQVNLSKAKKDLKKYADLQKITQSIVPEDKNQAAAVREIVNIAAANNVSLSSITFPASTLGNTPTGVAPAAPAAGAATSNTPSSGLSQLQPVKNIPGVYELLITVQGDADKPVRYDKFIAFLHALEQNRRTAQVSTITLQPDKDNRNFLTFTLGLKEYIKP